MTFHTMIALAPIVFAIHNAEEAPGMAAWSASLPGRFHPRVTRGQFGIAVLALTIVMACTAAWAWVAPGWGAPLWTLMAFQAAVALNAVVPHLAMLVRLRRYNPGVWTAALLVIPFSVWFFREAAMEGMVGSRGLIALGLAAPAVMLGMTLGSLWLGRCLARGGSGAAGRPRVGAV